jgi:ureidoglycolate lyase
MVRATALTAEAFRPFGDVIETEGHAPRWINGDTCRRFDDLARVDVAEAGGRPLISVFEAMPRELPLQVRVLERHPLSSQAFVPLEMQPFLVVVADDQAAAAAGRLRAFVSSGRQGVNYHRLTWHHPLLALGRTCRFVVIDRGGAGENCEEVAVGPAVWVTADRAPGPAGA